MFTRVHYAEPIAAFNPITAVSGDAIVLDIYDTDTVFTTDGGAVQATHGTNIGRWESLATGLYHHTEATDASRPTLQVEGSVRYARFQTKRLWHNTFPHSTPRTLIALFRWTTLTALRGAMGWAGGASGNAAWSNDGVDRHAWRTSNTGAQMPVPNTTVPTNFGVLTMRRDASDNIILRAGGVQVSSFAGSATSDAGFTLGRRHISDFGNYGDVDIQRVVLANSAMSTSLIAEYETWMAAAP